MKEKSIDDYVREIVQGLFEDEPIRPRKAAPVDEKTPSLIRAARSLAKNNDSFYSYINKRKLFLKQGKLLANYEDDYPEKLKVNRYCPTYDDLTDLELRSYFSWRTKLRRGDLQESCRTFAFLYMYELINGIGVKDPMEGLKKLDDFAVKYGALDDVIPKYYVNWRREYIVYYDLPVELIGAKSIRSFASEVVLLDRATAQSDAEIMQTVKLLAPGWLSRSKLYKTNEKDMDRVIAGTIRRMCRHYADKGGRSLSDQLFGPVTEGPVQLFYDAVFCDPLKRKTAEYVIAEGVCYRCEGGYWSVTRRHIAPRGQKKLEGLTRAIDGTMRTALNIGKPIQYPNQLKWVNKAISEEIQQLLDDKKKAEQAAKRVAIDFGVLSRIRSDAAETQEKLRVEDEDELPEEMPPADIPEAQPEPERSEGESPLNDAEYRLMQCLLYGGDTAWVQQEGKLKSVLLDSINEKLYDTFQDSVIDGEALVEDYVEELKEMVKP